MKRYALIAAMVMAIALVLTGCGGEAETPTEDSGAVDQTENSAASPMSVFEGLSGDILLGGATTPGPLMQEVTDEISAAYPDISFVVEGGGTGVGIQQIGEGVVDIGMGSRDLNAEEKAAYPDVQRFVIANEGVGIVVHPSNTIDGLSKDQLAGILSGEITDWSEVGGTAGPIGVYGRDEASATRQQMMDYTGIAEYGPLKGTPTSTTLMGDSVSADPSAIGFIGFSYEGDGVKFVALEGVPPTEENIISGAWPIVRQEGLFSNGDPEGLTKTFIDYCISGAIDDKIREFGFLPLAR